MAGINPLRQQANEMKQALYDEGLLDPSRVVQLEEIEQDDEDNPDFVEEVFGLFFRDSTKYIAAMEDSLNRTPVDPYILEKNLYRLKGSSSTIGAPKIRREVLQMRELCNQGEFDSARPYFQQLKIEQATLKQRVNAYLEVLKQAKEAEANAPPN